MHRRVTGVVFADGSTAVARQSKGLEYGTTVDAVTKLCMSMEAASNPPVALLHVDQFGICHAPHAKARAWLHESGRGSTRVLVHNRSDGALAFVTAARLSPAVPMIALC